VWALLVLVLVLVLLYVGFDDIWILMIPRWSALIMYRRDLCYADLVHLQKPTIQGPPQDPP
jgi:hypothetical protein